MEHIDTVYDIFGRERHATDRDDHMFFVKIHKNIMSSYLKFILDAFELVSIGQLRESRSEFCCFWGLPGWFGDGWRYDIRPGPPDTSTGILSASCTL